MVEYRRVFLSIFKVKQSWARCQRWSLSQKLATRSDNQKDLFSVVFWWSISCESVQDGCSFAVFSTVNIMKMICQFGNFLSSLSNVSGLGCASRIRSPFQAFRILWIKHRPPHGNPASSVRESVLPTMAPLWPRRVAEKLGQWISASHPQILRSDVLTRRLM